MGACPAHRPSESNPKVAQLSNLKQQATGPNTVTAAGLSQASRSPQCQTLARAASSLFRLSHGPSHGKQSECPCTDKTDLESSLAWTFQPLARPHCDLAGLFNGNLLFIELSLELCYQSWYIGAMVGVAACHDVDQGSSPHAVNHKKKAL